MTEDAFAVEILRIAEAAGREIMTIYERDFSVTQKEDDSPLTEADMASHHLILQELARLDADYPVLSEESTDITWEDRRHWHRFWLVDPIDGTKDFINRTGEFTVNIALIEDGVPILGVVTAPALDLAYWGSRRYGAFRREKGHKERIHVAEPPVEKRVVASKNHMNADTERFIESLAPYKLVQAGSSLKFCRIAEGSADIYPRMGPTCEWDTAAAQAVLEAAGGKVETFDEVPLRYNKEDVLNPWFIASGKWYPYHY